MSLDARSEGQPWPLPLGAKWGKMKGWDGWSVGLLCSRNAHAQKVLAWANSTSRRAIGWAGE